MSSRASAGAVLFVIAVGALGAYSAYRDGAFAPSPAQQEAAVSTESAAADAGAEASSETATPSAGPASGAVQSASSDATSSAGSDKAASDETTTATSTDPASGTDASAQASGPETSVQPDDPAEPQPTGSASGPSPSPGGSGSTSSSASADSASGAASSDQDAQTASATQDAGTETVETFELQTPTYDIVRVEPSGEAVIAGKASPGATVELRANGEVFASTTANRAGEWVIVLDKPLPPGDYDIALHSHHEDADAPKVSADRLAVSIREDGKETPLVALSRPDQPVEVLQKPEAQISARDAGTDSGGPASSSASGAQAQADETTASTEGESRTADAAASDAPAAPATSGDTAADDGDDTVIARLTVSEETRSVPRDPSGQTTLDTGGAAGAGTAGQETTSNQQANGAAAPAAGPGSQAASGNAAISSSEPASEQLTGTGGNAEIARAGDAASGDTVAPPSVPVTIESAELTDDNRFIVKGSSEPNANIWLYLDEEFVGAVRAGGSGRWTFETTQDLDAGRYTIRADQVRNMEGAVAARAEVPFGYAGRQTDPGEIGSRGETATSSAPASSAPQVEILGSDEDGVRVMVRRGDALWTIARHFYGDGFRYTTIYQANDGQIRDPDLIYPGQVFVLPGLTESEVLDAQDG